MRRFGSLATAFVALALAFAACAGAGSASSAGTDTIVGTVAAPGSASAPAPADAGGTGASTPAPTAVRRPATAPRAVLAPRPPIVSDPVPLTPRRRAETRAYARRHYGIDSDTIVAPHVIVEHYTGSETYSSAHNTFVPDTPDSELGELPGLCSQFIIDRDGTIYQQAPTTFLCRHTVGLNWTAVGIEHVGTSDGEVLADHRQLAASLRLTRWLQGRFAIPTANVIGHNESLSSPYHCEHVAALRAQTHDDWNRGDMTIYRRHLGPGPVGAGRGPGAAPRAAACNARLRR